MDFRNIDLEPAILDPLSVKTQVVLAVLLAAGLAFTIYIPGLKFDPLSLSGEIARSHPVFFGINLFGNGTNVAHPTIFHLINVLTAIGCSAFVALLASEISGCSGNRLSATTAIWAALLFAVFPAHVLALEILDGRAELLSAFFYLASLYYFSRLRLIQEKPYFWLSIICCAAAVACHAIAVTLPAVATVYALMLAPQAGGETKESTQSRISQFFHKPSPSELTALGTLWFVIIVYSLFIHGTSGHTLASQAFTVASSSQTLSQFLAILADQPDSLAKLWPKESYYIPFLSIMELAKGTVFPYLLAFVFALIRTCITPSLLRNFVFLSIFAVVMLAAGYCAWLIGPGTNPIPMYFLASAPLCLFLAFSFIPGADRVEREVVKTIAVLGTTILVFTLIVFSVSSLGNLEKYLQITEGGGAITSAWKPAKSYETLFTLPTNASREVSIDPLEIRVENGDEWHVFNEQYAQIIKSQQSLKLYPGKTGRQRVTVLIGLLEPPKARIDLLKFHLSIISDQPTEKIVNSIQVCWKSNQSGRLQMEKLQLKNGQFVCNVLSSKDWYDGGSVTAVGLRLPPGPYYVDLKSIEGAKGIY